MTLKEAKKEIIRLLKEKNEKNLIDLLNSCVNNEKLEKEFKGLDYKTCVVDKLSGEEFVQIENKNYLVSNLGRIKFRDGKVIPQRQDEKWNWKLDKEKFYDKTVAAEEIIYDYFMKKTTWLENEYKEIIKIYLDCELELHHICNKGDNRIDNLVYLPKFIHNKVNHNYKDKA